MFHCNRLADTGKNKLITGLQSVRYAPVCVYWARS